MPLERTNIRSMLGLRFRDGATEKPVTDGLRVTVRHGKGRGRVTRAVRTTSGAYAAQGLPGLRAYERSAASVLEESIEFLVSVEDPRGRYVPVTLSVDLPYTPKDGDRGLYPIAEMSSESGENVEPTCYLFSAVERPVGPGRSVVYADLREQGGSKPASHAVLEVTWKSKGTCRNGDMSDKSSLEEKVWHGVADARGRVAVQFPMPPIQLEELSDSPDDGNENTGDEEGQPISSTRCWGLEIKVRYESLGAERPLLSSILSQGYGKLYTEPGDDNDNKVESREVTLHYGEPLVLKTDDRPTLWIAEDTE